MKKFYELEWWDNEADDNRGMSRQTGRFFISRDACQKEADKLTQDVRQRDVRNQESKFREGISKDRKVIQEHNALVAAGLRETRMEYPTQEFEYDTSRLRWLDYYSVEEHEFEDG